MNGLDIAMGLIVAFGVVKGFFDGLINQLVSVLAFVAAILFAGLLAVPIREGLAIVAGASINSQITSVMAYILAFGIIMVVIVLLGRVVDIAVRFTPAVVLNRIAGSVLGAALWVVALSLIINIVATFDHDQALIKQETKENSYLYEPVKQMLPTLYPVVRDFFAD